MKDDITRTCSKRGNTRNTVQNLTWKSSNCPCTTHVTHAWMFSAAGIEQMYLCFHY